MENSKTFSRENLDISLTKRLTLKAQLSVLCLQELPSGE